MRHSFSPSSSYASRYTGRSCGASTWGRTSARVPTTPSPSCTTSTPTGGPSCWKTADGTVDGLGTVIGDPEADFRDDEGYVLDGPEFLTAFDGETGEALDTIDYQVPRGT